LLPAFTLQPLVENAVKHGVSPYRRVGTISIKAKKEANNLNLSITDDGFKMNGKPIAESNGLGLKLVRQQLENTYGDHAEITIVKNPTEGFSVRIKLPLG
jgi:sensor histidine kinase YesM